MNTTITEIIGALAELRRDHYAVCATSHWSSGCWGTYTREEHVRGHVRSNGYSNTAEAIEACHTYGTRYVALVSELEAIRGYKTPGFVLNFEIAKVLTNA